MTCSVRSLLSVLALGAGALQAFAVSTENYTYRTVTIGGGGFVTGVVFHPTTPNLTYARTDVGGAYRWHEEGGFWVALNDDIGGLDNEFMTQGVVSLAVDPQDDQRLYLATGQYLAPWAPPAALLASTDRGLTWTKIPLPFQLGGNSDGRSNGERLQVDPNHPQFLYLGTNADGLWRSRNYGKTWERVDSFPASSVTFVAFDKTSAKGNPTRTLYVGVNAPAGEPTLYRSTNGGGEWHAIPNQPLGTSARLIPHQGAIGYGSSHHTLYVTYSNALGPNGASAGAVWKLNLKTGAWTNITPPIGQGGFAGLSVDASNPDVLAVSTMNRWWPGDEIYRSTNGGTSWRATLSTGILDNSPSPWSVARSSHWTGDVDIDPHNPDRAIFITGYGLWVTRDFTKANTNEVVHWEFFNEELEETVAMSLASPKSGIFHLHSSLLDIGGFRHRYLRGSPPLVDYFSPYRSSTRSIAVAENDSSRIVRTVADGPGGQYSTNSGTSFSYFQTAAPGATTLGPGYIDISADGQRIVWIPNQSAPAYSTNNGASWTPSAGGPAAGTGNFRPVADKVASNKFYLMQPAAGTLWVSSDGAASFTAGATNLSATADVLPATVPGYEGHLWLPAWTQGLYVSTDSGASFSRVASVDEGYRVGFGKAAEGQDHPAVFIWGKVQDVVGFFRSDDAGASWVRINDDRHQFAYINHLVGDPRVFGRFYLGTSGRGIVYGQPEGLVTDHELPDPNDPVFQLPPEKVIYVDSLQTGWSGDGWGYQSLVFASTAQAHGGSSSIAVTFNQNWGIVRLHRSVFNVGQHQELRVWIHGGTTGGQGVRIIARKAGDVWVQDKIYHIPQSQVLANTWNEIVIPLSAFGLTPADNIIGFAIGNYGFNPTAAQPTLPTFYLDDIILR